MAAVVAAFPEAEIVELRDMHFPVTMRGYGRDAIDRYVSRVNQVIAGDR